MKKYAIIILLFLSGMTLAANEVSVRHDTGATLYFIIERASDTYILEDPNFLASVTWADSAETLDEHADILGKYTGTMPVTDPPIAAGIYNLHTYAQVGASPAATDTFVSAGQYYWTGTVLLDPSTVSHFSTTTADTLTLGQTKITHDGAGAALRIESTGGHAVELVPAGGGTYYAVYSPADLSIGGVTLTELADMADAWLAGQIGGSTTPYGN